MQTFFNILNSYQINVHILIFIQIKRFQEKNEATLKPAQREVKQAIENAEGNIAWMKTNYEKISSWLSE